MIVDAVDGERVDVAAGGPKDDQAAVLLGDVAFEPEDVGERDFGHAAAADGGDAGAADMLERDAISPLARTISSIAERGIAKCWPPIETVSAGMMVSVSGTRRVMRVPSPGLLSTSTMPPIRSMLERTTSMPTPRPEMAVTSLAVDRPGLEDQRELLARR